MSAQQFSTEHIAAISAIRPEEVHAVIWAIAESQIARAQQIYKDAEASPKPLGNDWKPSIMAGLSCLYSVLHLCEVPKSQIKYIGRDLMLGPDVEARTRLRIAQVLADWAEGSSGRDEEEHQLKRALMVLPAADHYLDLRYSIIAAQCRLFLRRGEQKWAEQKMRAAFTDAQQRFQSHWVHYFMLELSKLYDANGDLRSSLNTLQFSIRWARQNGDRVSEAVSAIQQLGLLVQSRNWAGSNTLVESLTVLVADPKLAGVPQIRTRFWVLRVSSSAMLGKIADAQEACNSARQALGEWQGVFVRQLASKSVADAGSSFVVPDVHGMSSGLRVKGWCYYEAHAWVMLVSALCVRGDNMREEAASFLRLAQDGIAKGELDGAKWQLLPLKLQVLLHKIDLCLATLQIDEAQMALSQAMNVVAEADKYKASTGGGRSGEFWRSNRDAIALRWAMYKHRIGDFDEATDAYQCVVSNGPADLRFAARVNLAVLRLSGEGARDEDNGTAVRQLLAAMEEELSAAPNGSQESVRRALLEFLQGLESSKEPVRAKTHLLGCLRACGEIADAALQGWTLCMLGTLVLPTGQYEQAMKMCAAGQAIAQRGQDPLQNAAAIGILAHIERAVGDQGRCEKLLEISRSCLEQFDTKIQGSG